MLPIFSSVASSVVDGLVCLGTVVHYWRSPVGFGQ